MKKILEYKYHILLFATLLFAFILRLKYLNINQALWFDEAEYLCIAKNWAYDLTYPISILRPPLLPLFQALSYKLGFGSEIFFRLVEILFSLGSVFITYLLGKELYNKKVGLISSFLMAVFHHNLFFTARIMTDIPTLTIWLLALYLFWKGYVKKESKKYLWWAGFVISLGILIRYTIIMVGLVFLLFLLCSEGLKFLRKKDLWVSALIALLTLFPYLLWSYNTYGKIGVLTAGASYGVQIRLMDYIKYFTTYLYSPVPFLGGTIFQMFLILFLGGIIISLFNLIIGWDLIKKEENLKSDLFTIFIILVPFLYFGLKFPAFEPRYLLYIFPAVFFFTAKMLLEIEKYLERYNKILAIVIIILILCFGAYHHLRYADSLIKSKATSYVQFRQAGEWIKQHSEPQDLVLSDGAPMMQYYSDRIVIGWTTEEDFLSYIKEKRPKYMIITPIERSADWVYAWPNNNLDMVIPVIAYYFDAEKTMPSMVIYQFQTYEKQ